MSGRKILLATAACLFLGGGAALAYSYGFEHNELEDLFCSDLANQQVYEKTRMDHYSILIPGKEGWIFRTENDFRANWQMNERTQDFLLALQQAFRQHNAELVVLMPPVRGLAHADMLFRSDRKKYNMKDIDAAWQKYEGAIASLQKKGINVVGINRDEVTADFFYKRDHHWTASGAKVAAAKIAGVVKTLPAYEQIAKADFVTTQQQPIEYQSTFEKAFKKICQTELPNEVVPHYVTASATTAQSPSDLFGDQKSAPQVVLLGTSNSVNDSSQANFEGFLKDYLSSDIVNYSYIGGGIDTGIMSYVNSDHFKNPAPKIVIWEVPGYYDFNIMDDKLFNQVIPAAMGACPNPVHRKTLQVEAGKTPILNLESENAAILQPASYAQPATGGIDHSMYLHLDFSKPVKGKFKVEFQYENNGTKSQNFQRSDRYPADGDFYTLFPANNGRLQEVSIVMEDGTEPRKLNVQVCRLPDEL